MKEKLVSIIVNCYNGEKIPPKTLRKYTKTRIFKLGIDFLG